VDRSLRAEPSSIITKWNEGRRHRLGQPDCRHRTQRAGQSPAAWKKRPKQLCRWRKAAGRHAETACRPWCGPMTVVSELLPRTPGGRNPQSPSSCRAPDGNAASDEGTHVRAVTSCPYRPGAHRRGAGLSSPAAVESPSRRFLAVDRPSPFVVCHPRRPKVQQVDRRTKTRSSRPTSARRHPPRSKENVETNLDAATQDCAPPPPAIDSRLRANSLRGDDAVGPQTGHPSWGGFSRAAVSP